MTCTPRKKSGLDAIRRTDDMHDALREIVRIDEEADDADADGAGGYRAVSRSLAWHCMRAALPADIRRRVRSGEAVAVVVRAPDADWCAALNLVLAADTRQVVRIVRDGSSRGGHKPSVGNADVAMALADGSTVVGVSTDPSAYLPSALMSVADAVVAVTAPEGRLLRALLRRHAAGRVPDLPAGVAAGLGFSEIVSAFRPGASARDVVAALASIRERKARPSAGDVPPLEDLPCDGALRDFGRAVIEDVGAWRAGELAWSAVTSRALLVGKPGVGKTMFARSLARSLGVRLAALSCGDLFARTDGYLHSVVQALQRGIDEARAVGGVLLLDEFEALCPCRADMDGKNRDYFTILVTRVLTLLDGAGSVAGGADDLTGVVVLAATNLPDRVDEAAFRRLHRVIEIGPPGPEVLARVLRTHLGARLPDVDLAVIAALAPGTTPATAAQWVRDAARAARAEGRELTFRDLLAVVAPPDDRPHAVLRRIAVHEAGHVVGFHAAGTPLAAVSIVRAGILEGVTSLDPDRPVSHGRRSDLDAQVIAVLAGRAAERVLIGDVSAGAEADLAMATKSLALAHGAQGLGRGLIHRGDPWAMLAYDAPLRGAVEADLRRLYARALALIRRRRAAVDLIADALLERRLRTGSDVARLLETVDPGPTARGGAPG